MLVQPLGKYEEINELGRPKNNVKLKNNNEEGLCDEAMKVDEKDEMYIPSGIISDNKKMPWCYSPMPLDKEK